MLIPRTDPCFFLHYALSAFFVVALVSPGKHWLSGQMTPAHSCLVDTYAYGCLPVANKLLANEHFKREEMHLAEGHGQSDFSNELLIKMKYTATISYDSPVCIREAIARTQVE